MSDRQRRARSEQRAIGAVTLVSHGRVFALGALLVAAGTASAATTVTVGTEATRSVIAGKMVSPGTPPFDGELVIEGDTITCLKATCPHPVGASVFTVSNGYVFPGFVDAHNHVAYNVLPKWIPPHFYHNRGEWQRAAEYKTFKAPYNTLKTTLLCEMVKYGEVKALLSGVTTIQGTGANQRCFSPLIRNAENQNHLPVASTYIRTFILDISSFNSTINWSVTKAFVVHLAEGIDATSRAEFQTLKQKKLLKPGTAVIHGTAFEDAEFAEMAAAGTKLIWSPRSNLTLYNQTTKIDRALAKGVTVSLGVDWNATGSDNIFEELRTASQVNQTTLGNVIAEGDWLGMVTVNPAKALALDAYVGTLTEGLKGDLVVLAAHDPDAAKSLLKSDLEDVEMVWVGGKLLYGSDTLVEHVRPGACEALTVKGAHQRVCVKDDVDSAPKAKQTLAQITSALKAKYPSLAPLAP